MSDYQLAAEAPSPEAAPPPSGQRHLGRDLAIDMVVLALAFLLVSLVIPIAFFAVRAVAQGMDLTALGGISPDEIMRLVGVDGIVTLLVVQNLIFIALPYARVVWLRREPRAELGLQLPRPLRDLALGVGLGVLVLLCNAALGLTFASFGVRQNQAAEYPLYPGDYAGQIAFLVGAAIIVPIGEEILFRGYLFRTLRRIWGARPWAAYVVSALIFALAHAAAATEGLIALLVPAFVMGLLLAWGTERTRSIIPSVIAHSMNNGLALLALLACVNGTIPCPEL
jgi:uncharacterized protein